MPKYCSNCGKELKETASFCMKCGLPVAGYERIKNNDVQAHKIKNQGKNSFAVKALALVSVLLLIMIGIVSYKILFSLGASGDGSLLNKQDFNGHTYAYSDSSLTWEQAEAYCEKSGGHLATITTPDEEEFVKTLIQKGSKNTYWIGAQKEEKSGKYAWVTGEPFEYSKWANGEPNNFGGVENAALMFRITNPMNESASAPGLWNDLKSDGSLDSYDKSFYGVENIGFIYAGASFASSIFYIIMLILLVILLIFTLYSRWRINKKLQ